MASKYFISSISISLETAYESAICLEQICLEVSRSQDEKILAYHASLLLWPVPNACASRDTPTAWRVRMSWGRRSNCHLRTWLIVRFQQLALLGQLSLTAVIKWPYGNRGTTASKNHWKIVWFICLYYDIMRYSIFRIPTFSSFFTSKNRFGLHLSSFTDLQCQLLLSLACHLRSTCECYTTTCRAVFFQCLCLEKTIPHLQSWFGFGKLGQRVVFVLIL